MVAEDMAVAGADTPLLVAVVEFPEALFGEAVVPLVSVEGVLAATFAEVP